MLITPTLECGGAERYVSLLCRYLNKDRFSVCLLVLDNEHPFYEIEDPRVEVINLGIRHARNALFAIRREINQRKPDVVYSVANHINLLLATFRWMFPKHILFIARESSIMSSNLRRSKWPALFRKLANKFYDRLDCIICQSNAMQLDLTQNLGIPVQKTEMIPNPVAVDPALKPAPPAPGIMKLLTVARLSEEKGLDRLIRAVAKLDFPFIYNIIGEGPEREKLEALIAALQLGDKVFLQGEQLRPYHHQEDAHLFLMGSYYEGFPNVLIEAGVLGIPVVAFDAPGGIAEIIEDGLNGFLVKSSKEEVFMSAILRAREHKFNHEKIIAATKIRYGVDKIIPATENLIIRLLAEKTGQQLK